LVHAATENSQKRPSNKGGIGEGSKTKKTTATEDGSEKSETSKKAKIPQKSIIDGLNTEPNQSGKKTPMKAKEGGEKSTKKSPPFKNHNVDDNSGRDNVDGRDLDHEPQVEKAGSKKKRKPGESSVVKNKDHETKKSKKQEESLPSKKLPVSTPMSIEKGKSYCWNAGQRI
jgi:hypothetical protein